MSCSSAQELSDIISASLSLRICLTHGVLGQGSHLPANCLLLSRHLPLHGIQNWELSCEDAEGRGPGELGKLFRVPIKFCDAILLLSGPRLPMAERILES